MAKLTVVGRDQLVLSMVGLSPLDRLTAVLYARRHLFRPIHPEHSSKDIPLILGSNLHDPRDPVSAQLSRSYIPDCYPLSLDAILVRNVYIVVHVKLMRSYYDPSPLLKYIVASREAIK